MQNFVKICVYLLFALPTKETKIEFYVKLLSPNMLVPSEKMQLFELYKIMYAVTLNNALSVHEVIKKNVVSLTSVQMQTYTKVHRVR